jgi:hypothetical protein
MKFLMKVFVALCGFLLFTQCRRKPQAMNIDRWLELEYANRFKVLATYSEDVIRNWSFGEKHSIVAEKSNPLIQSSIHWDNREQGLKLTKAIVDGAFEKAHRAFTDAQDLYTIIHASDLKDIAVSIKDDVAMVLIFAEPTSSHRQHSLTILETCLGQWPKKSDYTIEVSCMEPTEYGKDFKDIVPLIYWTQSHDGFEKNKIYWTSCPFDHTFSAHEVSKNWQYNTGSSRFMACSDKAQKEAESWAKIHIKKPITLSNLIEYDQSSANIDIVNIKFLFNYSSKEEESTNSYKETDGGISLDYDVEKNIVVGKIKIEK